MARRVLGIVFGDDPGADSAHIAVTIASRLEEVPEEMMAPVGEGVYHNAMGVLTAVVSMCHTTPTWTSRRLAAATCLGFPKATPGA